MATFWGCEISSTSPHVHEPDPADELQLTSAVLVSGKGKSFLTVQADDGKEMTVCTMVSGSREQCKLDLLLGGGNDKITFRVSGDKSAKLHLTGYLVVPQEYHQQDEDEEEEDEKVLAKNMFGTARLADDDDDDEEDEDFEEGDEEEEEDEESDEEEEAASSKLIDDEAEEDDDDEESEDMDEKEVRLPEFEKESKKRSAPEPAKMETPASKKAKSDGPEGSFLQSIVSYLSEKGTSPLSKIGNECKKPAGVKGKLKAFLGLHPDTFEIDGMNVKLK